MVAITRLFVMLTYGIPCLLLNLLICASIFRIDPQQRFASSFYSFILFHAFWDILGYVDSYLIFRFPIFMFFYHFYHDFDPSWKTTAIYCITFFSFCVRSLATTALVLNRFTAVVYNNKASSDMHTWSTRSRCLTVFLSLVTAACLNFYNFDTRVQFMRVQMTEDDSYVWFMFLDDTARPWMNEQLIVLVWAASTWCFSLAVCFLIIWHVTCGGGVSPELERRELTHFIIVLVIVLLDFPFLGCQIMSYLLDKNDFPAAMDAVRVGSPVIPFIYDVRFLCTPALLVVFDGVIRVRVLATLGFGDKSSTAVGTVVGNGNA